MPWWNGLIGDNTPKIIARLPFVERPDHPAGLPVFVISKPLADAAVRDRILYAAKVERWRGDITSALEANEITIEASSEADGLAAILLSTPGSLDPKLLPALFSTLGLSISDLHEVGSHAHRFHLSQPD